MIEPFKYSEPIRYQGDVIDTDLKLKLYIDMLKPRLIEEKMLILLRQGKISKWFSGIGQEAIAVGVANSLMPEEYILPMHRNLGVFTTRGIPLGRLFSQWQGKAHGFTKGRDRSFHFGTQEYKIVGMISHLGPQLGVADGIALGNLLKENGQVCAVFTGEGGTSEGDFHEALNVAAVWDLPVLFCIENNGYGLSTPTHEQYRCGDLIDKGIGYGMEAHYIDGNNIVEVYDRVSYIAQSVRERPRPVLLEFKTFRMRGHEEASGTKYVSQHLLDSWAARDPVVNYQAYLKEMGILGEDMEVEIRKEIAHEINEQLKIAFDEAPIDPDMESELADVFHPFDYEEIAPSREVENIRLVDAISQGLKQSMEKYGNMVVMGQDIAEYGGVFKVTEGFVEQFGRSRIRNTPICESAIIEAAMGLSVQGIKSVVEMQFADFVSSGFNPLVNYLAKVHYRWGQPADVVVRMPCGAGVGAGPFHSQTNEAWFTKTPGLKVVYPAFPHDAKGLLNTAINDPNPVLFFEHKALYRIAYQDVPKGYYTLPFGKGCLLQEGDEVSIITYGLGVHWVLQLLERNPGVSADLLDLRTLVPLDKDAIYKTVKRTGRVLIVHEDTVFNGIGGEVSALISEHCFEYLDAPVKRVGSIDTPVPFAKVLEDIYLPANRLQAALTSLLEY